MLAELRASVAGLAFTTPRIPIVSTVTGDLVDAAEFCTPEYWVSYTHL